MIWAQKKKLEKAPPQSAAKMPPIMLESFRVIMRPPRGSDYASWAVVRGENRNYLEPYEPSWPNNNLSPEFFARRLQRQTKNWLTDEAYAFLIFTKDRELIGGMNINNICRGAGQYGSLGYWISEEFQGQGYMSEAMRLTIRFCFEELKLHRIHGACLLHNERSMSLLKRAGFIEEGLAKKYLKINGEWQDHILFGLPVEEWSA